MQDARERLIRYLDDAWAVEKSLPTVFADFRKEITDVELESLFRTLEHTADQHRQALETQIRARGKEPSGGKGLMNQIFAKTLDILHAAHDEYEKSVTNLMKTYTIVRFQTAVYEAIRAYAETQGESEVARLAAQHERESEELAQRVWPFVTAVAARNPQPI